MTPNVFITGADRGLGLGLCAGMLEQGWEVFAGQYTPAWAELAGLAAQYPRSLRIIPLDVSSLESATQAARSVEAIAEGLDMLINNAGVISQTTAGSIRNPQDYTEMHRLYDINALGPLRVVQAFLPLADRGRLKRLCFVSSEAGSIARSERTSWYGYCMSKSALNMGVKILYNDLRPQGYTFRVYHPGWIRSYMFGTKNLEATQEPEEAAAKAIPFFLGPREDENILVMVDNEGNEWPW
ncbi:MAG: SDR family oxidoreductase [Chloroflexota bacterium]|nr:MAG: SDR family oxidoreductase [Chloroflexota bacterium]